LEVQGSVGYSASNQASKPPVIGLALLTPFFVMMSAARALMFSSGQVQ